MTDRSQQESVCAHRHSCVTALTPLDRTKRVKDARSEAQKEIEAYRKEKEDEFQKFEKEVRWPENEPHGCWTDNGTAQLRQQEG